MLDGEGVMWIFATAVFLVLVFFLYRRTKTTLNVLGVALALIVGTIALIVSYDCQDPSTYVDRGSQVSVSVSYNLNGCDNAHPLMVTITNGADKTLEKIEWQIAAYVPGRSTNIAKYQVPG